MIQIVDHRPQTSDRKENRQEIKIKARLLKDELGLSWSRPIGSGKDA
jgi:hypothetical protein